MKKPPRDIVKIVKPLDRDTGWQIDTELTEEELEAIGKVTVQWAHLEHAVYVRTVELAADAGLAPPEEAKSLSFEKRLKAFRSIARMVIRDETQLKSAETLADRIANAKDLRHKISHGLWDWSEENTEKLAAYSFRPGYSYEHPFDLTKLRKLLDNLGEILFELIYPGGLGEVEIVPSKSRHPGEIVKADPWLGIPPYDGSKKK